MKKLLTLALFTLGLTSAAESAEYKVDPAKSKIAFSGTQQGNAFKGVFGKWDAVINFDPADLANSKVSVTFDTGSAKTGDQFIDTTLPGDDWFNVAKYPKATYTSDKIAKNSDGSYSCEGKLTIRDKTVPTNFNFALTPADLATMPVKTTFSLNLDRLAFGIGEGPDKEGKMVSLQIKVDVELIASK
jgi:polyisoprenoid-binding protein YceI